MLINNCGREDQQRQNCVLYGEQCNDKEKPVKSPEPVVGPTGPEGQSGADGLSVIFDSFDNVTCPSGGKTILIAQDVNNNGLIDPLIDLNIRSMDICNGSDGQQGSQGEQGQQGQQGQQGEQGPVSEFTPVEIVDPCGDKPDIYDEVFLRLFNGQLLWSLSDNQNGLNTRFSLAVPGSWKTTDGSHCFFSIDNDYQLYNEHY